MGWARGALLGVLRIRLIGFDHGSNPKEEGGVPVAQTKDRGFGHFLAGYLWPHLWETQKVVAWVLTALARFFGLKWVFDDIAFTGDPLTIQHLATPANHFLQSM